MKKYKNRLKNVIVTAALLSYISLSNIQRVYAMENSKLVTGTKDLLNDGAKALLGIVPLTTILLELWYNSKLQAADETEEKPIKKKMKSILICGVLAFVISSLVNIIIGYYK